MNDRIQKVMAEAFGVPVASITSGSNQDNTENWDSLHHVKMIVFLEREFDIEIPDEKVGTMISYQSIKEVVDGCTRTN